MIKKHHKVSHNKSYLEYTIEKKNGSKRRICAPSKHLLKAQRKLLPELYDILTIKQSKNGNNILLYGFIKGLNCVSCAKQHQNYMTTICMDIQNFFDSVTKEQVKHQLKEYRISTKLKTALDNEFLFHKDGTLAQGFATSPLLANIVLYDIINTINTILIQLSIKSVITAYADDIQISINTENATIINNIIQVVTKILNQNNFKIKKGKTRIRYAKYGYRKILGISVATDLKPSRNLIRKIRAAKHQQNEASLNGLLEASYLKLPK